MVQAVTTTNDTTAAAAAMKKATGMNKDDFLKLFVTQLQNQDPLNPQDSSQFLGQLAQLTQVEQSYNTNTNLQKMIDAQNNSSALAAVTFIGKEVVAQGPQMALPATGAMDISYRLPQAAQKVYVEIKDASGNVVRNLSDGGHASGDYSVAWDGKATNGSQLPAGIYTMTVTGIDTTGARFSATPLMRGNVESVKFDSGSPVLTINGYDVSLTDIVSVKGA